MKVSLVGGEFGGEGKASSLIEKIRCALIEQQVQLGFYYNGGNLRELAEIVEGNNLYKTDAILWFPQVSNEEAKMLPTKNPHNNTLLVTSKRNVNKDYNAGDLVARALSSRSNLLVEFSISNSNDTNMYVMSIIDPLGNCYAQTSNLKEFVKTLIVRMRFLLGAKRIPSIALGPNVPIPHIYNTDLDNLTALSRIVRGLSDELTKIIDPQIEKARFLGACSLRCTEGGFSSYRSKEGLVYVSRRNINKSEICPESFVPVFTSPNFDSVLYYGDQKPSTDAPIHLYLYDRFPKVQYIFHCHAYTDMNHAYAGVFPCGDLREAEVLSSLCPDKNYLSYAWKLRGHGSLIMGSLEDIATVRLEPRPLLESQFDTKE